MIINYSHYKDLLSQYTTNLGKTKESVEKYIQNIEKLMKNGIMSGRIHDELRIYCEHVQKVPSMIEEVTSKLECVLNGYLEDMNTAQAIDGEYILYPASYTGTRDYTEEAFASMRRKCDAAVYGWKVLDTINDKAENLVSKAMAFIGDRFDWFNVRQMQMLVMEANDISQNTLKDIRGRLVRTEGEYRRLMGQIDGVLQSLNEYIKILLEVVDSNVETFSMSKFSPRLENLSNIIIASIEKVGTDEAITLEDIDRFADLSIDIIGYDDIISKYMMDMIGTFDEDLWIVILTQMFTIARESIIGMLCDEDYDYNQYLLDQEMLAIIDETAERETFGESEEKESLERIELFLKYAKQYGKDWEYFLEGKRDENGRLLLDRRTTEYKLFKKTFESLDNTKDIISYGSDWCEVLAKFCADNDRNIEILESLEENYASNEAIAKSLSRIRAVYERRIDSITDSIVKTILDHGLDAVSELDKYLDISVFSVLGGIETGIDIIGNVTGLSPEACAKYELLTTGSDVLNSSRSAYENALKKLKACSPESQQYRECIANLKNCFECYRIAQKRMLEKMAVASYGSERDYYRYCAEEMDRLTIDNYEDFEMHTYEEYMSR